MNKEFKVNGINNATYIFFKTGIEPGIEDIGGKKIFVFPFRDKVILSNRTFIKIVKGELEEEVKLGSFLKFRNKIMDIRYSKEQV